MIKKTTINLNQEIQKTEELKNKVKLAKQRINETVVRGGGSTSKSLAEVPNNIKSMISKNYKKVAIGNINGFSDLYVEPNTGRIYNVTLNLSFKPRIVFLNFGWMGSNSTLYTKVDNTNTEHIVERRNGSWYSFQVSSISSSSISFRFTGCSNNLGYHASLTSFVAIE